MIRQSPKLLHYRLGPFEIEYQVGPLAYCLKLSHRMRQLYLVFNVVKFSAVLEDLIKEAASPTAIYCCRQRTRVESGRNIR